MNFGDNTTRIIIAVVGVLTLLAGGAFISYKKNKKKTSRNSQSGIIQVGDGNRVTGEDDKSTNQK
jgi:LPXTG-motif cell wall-anchored protein